MNLAVVSHKICWPSEASPSGFMTDGGFPMQMSAISQLFTSTTVVVPCVNSEDPVGLSPLNGKMLSVVPLSVPLGTGFRRKLDFPFWLLKNARVILREVRHADAVHTPIPGDVGTIGMLFALLLRKPLFVRHCGNWLVQRTIAEKFWKWSMERFAGGKNVMLATGGGSKAPSSRNKNINWIFSTSLRFEQIVGNIPHEAPQDGKLKLIIACRQEARKGTDIVISTLPLIAKNFRDYSLDVVGGGSLLEKLKKQAIDLGVEDRVIFHGKVEQARVVALMRQAHLFCYPTSASEGFPKVVLEALACGLPVITTNVSVLPDLISSGQGVILDEATPTALSASIKQICANSEVYCRASEKAIETAQNFSLERWGDVIGKRLRESWDVSSLS